MAPSSPACFWAHTCAVKGRARQASVSGTGYASLTPGLEVKPRVKAWPCQGARESPEQRACSPFRATFGRLLVAVLPGGRGSVSRLSAGGVAVARPVCSPRRRRGRPPRLLPQAALKAAQWAPGPIETQPGETTPASFRERRLELHGEWMFLISHLCSEFPARQAGCSKSVTR